MGRKCLVLVAEHKILGGSALCGEDISCPRSWEEFQQIVRNWEEADVGMGHAIRSMEPVHKRLAVPLLPGSFKTNLGPEGVTILDLFEGGVSKIKYFHFPTFYNII